MYNGHKNRNHWNVALWIGNDYGLYQAARECIRRHRNRADAARELLDILPTHTPDGAPYSLTSVRAALVGFGDYTVNTGERERLYAHAKACDNAWFDALKLEFGKRAAQVRYTHLGREGKYAKLYADYQAACKALQAAP